MPCRDDELFAQGPEQPNPVTPPRPLHNAGASHDQSNAEEPVEEPAENDPKLDDEDDEDDEADEASDKPKRHRELNVYETVKRWVTGKMAEFELCDIQHQLELEARKLMNESGMVKPPNHKETKKQACNVEEECISYKSLQYLT